MTESEQLKQNTDKAWLEQRNKELNTYMDYLHDNIKIALKNTRDALFILMGTWAAMMVASFSGIAVIHITLFVVYLFALVYMVYRDRKSAQAVSELKGALKILRILGLIDYDWDSLGGRRRRRVLSDLVDKVKSWASKKKEVQEKAYAPA